MSDSTARDAWVARVLGVGATPVSAAARDAQAVAPDTAFRKLMLVWRAAQARLASALDALASTLVSHPEMRADPRFEAIRQAAATLPRLVPAFGGELEDLLDAGINAGSGPKAATLAADAVAAIDRYRAELAAAAQLAALEEFSAKDLGTALPLGSALDAVLAQMRAQLAKPA